MYCLSNRNSNKVLYVIGIRHDYNYENFNSLVKNVIEKCDFLLLECNLDEIDKFSFLDNVEKESESLENRINFEILLKLLQVIPKHIFERCRYSPLKEIMMVYFLIKIENSFRSGSYRKQNSEETLWKKFGNKAGLEESQQHMGRLISFTDLIFGGKTVTSNNIYQCMQYIDYFTSEMAKLIPEDQNGTNEMLKNYGSTIPVELNNEIMVEKIHNYYTKEDKHTILVVIGSFHLFGDNSVIKLLEAKDYDIEFLTSDIYVEGKDDDIEFLTSDIYVEGKDDYIGIKDYDTEFIKLDNCI